MKKLLLFFCLPITVYSQNTIGFPDVFNYSKENYNAGFQNWEIKQDKNGIIYSANNEGLLSFDSRYWNLYPLPNKTIVRSVEIGQDNRIYVGGQDELGYFAPAKNGRLEYHSLTPLVPPKDKSFGDVWDIVSYKKGIFFRSINKIFQYTNGILVTYNAPAEWRYLGISNGHLFAHDKTTGLMSFDNSVWSPLSIENELPFNDPVTSILPLQNDSSVITTLKTDCIYFTKTAFLKFRLPTLSCLKTRESMPLPL